MIPWMTQKQLQDNCFLIFHANFHRNWPKNYQKNVWPNMGMQKSQTGPQKEPQKGPHFKKTLSLKFGLFNQKSTIICHIHIRIDSETFQTKILNNKKALGFTMFEIEAKTRTEIWPIWCVFWKHIDN